jgi:excinuclease UvrABC helicase subunit UvrB
MFKIHSEYKPAGDQPQAIEKLVEGINKWEKFQTLLGVTGSRKNFYYGKYNREGTKTYSNFGT